MLLDTCLGFFVVNLRSMLAGRQKEEGKQGLLFIEDPRWSPEAASLDNASKEDGKRCINITVFVQDRSSTLHMGMTMAVRGELCMLCAHSIMPSRPP